MSKLYDIAILGADDPASWLSAAAFAGRDLRVALILGHAPDPDTVAFPWLPLDLARHAELMAQAGLVPAAAPRPPFTPDLQVIVAGKAIDLAADPLFFERGIKRDLGGDAAILIELSQALGRGASEFIAAAAADPSSPLNRLYAAVPPDRPWSGWFKKRGPTLPESPPFSRAASGAPAPIRSAFLAAATAVLAAPLPPEPTLAQVAMLWNFCRGARPGPGATLGLREQAAARIAKRGAVIEGDPETVIAEGRSVHSVRLKSRAIVDAKILVAASSMLARLLSPGKSGPRPGKSPDPAMERATFFYRIEKSSLPEALAERAVVAADPGKPLSGANLMVIVRSPRVPRRQTMAITVFAPPGAIDPESLPQALAASLPWIEPAAITPDDTRAPIIASCPPLNYLLAPPPSPAPVFENFFPLPGDPLPGWGPAGLIISLRALLAAGLDLLPKYKGRL
ncbi:MAG TPA: hypothetical protein VM658_05840 [bacterium]|nr:hypothetical protein [bacterium]